MLAHVLRRQGREAEFEACLHAVLELDPNYEEAHCDLGGSLRVRGELAEAIECFRRAIAIDPVYAAAHAELGFALALEARHRQDEPAVDQKRTALEHLKRSVALDPEYSWSRIYLANELCHFGRTREARIHYEAAARLCPDDGFVLVLYADFLSVMGGANSQAQHWFERALAVDGEDDRVHYWYGKHLLRVKRYTEARRELLLADRLGNPHALALLASVDDDD